MQFLPDPDVGVDLTSPLPSQLAPQVTPLLILSEEANYWPADMPDMVDMELDSVEADMADMVDGVVLDMVDGVVLDMVDGVVLMADVVVTEVMEPAFTAQVMLVLELVMELVFTGQVMVAMAMELAFTDLVMEDMVQDAVDLDTVDTADTADFTDLLTEPAFSEDPLQVLT